MSELRRFRITHEGYITVAAKAEVIVEAKSEAEAATFCSYDGSTWVSHRLVEVDAIELPHPGDLIVSEVMDDEDAAVDREDGSTAAQRLTAMLPASGDGHPLGPGMQVWVMLDGDVVGCRVYSIMAGLVGIVGNDEFEDDEPWTCDVSPEKCFVDRDAAIAGAEGASHG